MTIKKDQNDLQKQNGTNFPPQQDPFYGKDPVMILHLMGIVWYKMGKDATYEKVVNEIGRLYDILQKGLVELALQSLPQEKHQEVQDLLQKGASNEELQRYLLANIPNFIEKMEKYILKFQYDYLGPELAEKLAFPSPEIEES